MAQVLKSAKNGQIEVKALYTAGDLAFLMGVSHSTAIRLIDRGEIRGFMIPHKRRERRVTHQNLILFLRRYPGFSYMLDRLNGYDPGMDFPGYTEPPQTPTRPIAATGPWSKARPRSVKRGKIPKAASYSANEAAFLLGLARETVVGKLSAGVIKGIKLPAAGLTTWKWRVTHGALVAFVKQNPEFRFALDRLLGYDPRVDFPGPAGKVRLRKSPLLAPGNPG